MTDVCGKDNVRGGGVGDGGGGEGGGDSKEISLSRSRSRSPNPDTCEDTQRTTHEFNPGVDARCCFDVNTNARGVIYAT